MNLTTKLNKFVLCECRNIARLEDHSGALVCHECADEMEDEQGYSSIVAWIDYDFEECESHYENTYNEQSENLNDN